MARHDSPKLMSGVAVNRQDSINEPLFNRVDHFLKSVASRAVRKALNSVTQFRQHWGA